MAIWFFCGRMGVGKTLGMTWLGWLMQYNGLDIYSNYPVNFEHTPIRQPAEVGGILPQADSATGRYTSSMFLGDELWSWMDSRASGSSANRMLSTILMASGKKGFDIAHTAQHYMQPDNRIRKHTDFFVEPDLSGNILKLKVSAWCGESGGQPLLRPIKTMYIDAKPVYRLYDTKAPIYQLDEEYIKGLFGEASNTL